MQEIEPFDTSWTTEKIREHYVFPLLKITTVLQEILEQKVYGYVMVMLQGNKGLRVTIRNKDFTFGYEIERLYIEHMSIDFIVRECLYHYKKEIEKRYIKEE